MKTAGRKWVRSELQINRDLVLPKKIFFRLLRILPCIGNPTDVILLTSLCLFIHANGRKRGGEKSDEILSES